LVKKERIAPHPRPWRAAVYRVIFQFDTPAGKLFDVLLLLAILLGIVTVSLETVPTIADHVKAWLRGIEWTLTGLFTVEYVLRLICVRKPLRYALSFFGIVDLLSFLPTYFVWRTPVSQMLVVLRSLRLLRVFRILELAEFMSEAEILGRAIWNARAKIVVFLITILIAVTISGTGMYLVENDQQGSHFTSIPQAMYWAIVTMTTVGYGDIVPVTAWGKVLSAALILLGYSLIIVPTGFVSAELVVDRTRRSTAASCLRCGAGQHASRARFCHQCGHPLTSAAGDPGRPED
jgi:voltage-gated potassium channel